MFWNRNNGKSHYASPTTTNPLARSADLIIQEVDDEVLIYDEYNSTAHCLSPEAARIWRACDGEKSEDAIAEELELDSYVVRHTLVELKTLALVSFDAELDSDEFTSNGATRREFGLKAAKLGGAVAVAPAIYTILAPTAGAATATVPNFVCNFFSGSSCDACTGVCGCCCCCQGCPKTPNDTSGASCKMCSSVDFCDAAQASVKAGDPNNQDGCLDQLKAIFALTDPTGPPFTGPACNSGPNCSAPPKNDCGPPCVSGTADCRGHDCNCFGVGDPCKIITT